MPIFEKELIGNIPNRLSIPDVDLRSLDEAPIATPTGPFEPLDHSGNRIPKTIADLAKYRTYQFTGFQKPYGTASAAEIQENLKYPHYRRGDNLENIYGIGQSAWSQWGNAWVKFGANAAGIFAQSFAAIPNVIDSIRKGKVSELSGDMDGFEGTIDNWLHNLENTFPNYYTDRELDSPWIAAIPFAPGSANFWGDKFVKNLGFTVGVISGVLVQSAIITAVTGGTGTVPLVASHVARLSLRLSKVASMFKKAQIAARLAKSAGVTNKTYGVVKALESMSSLGKLKNGAQFATTMLGASITEAGVESREGYKQIKEELLKDFYYDNGAPALGADLEAIEKISIDAMNVRFGINAAILFMTNSLLFGNLAKNIRVAGASVKGGFIVKSKKGGLADLKSFGLKEGSLDVFERKVKTGFANRAWERVRPSIPVMFSEGVYEEGGQFATEKGTYDYFTRKYKNLNNPRNRQAWDTLEETIKSTMHGLHEQFTTDEGWQNMFIGALTGAFVTGVQGIVDKRRKSDANSRTDKVINLLGENYLTGIFKQKYEDTAQSIAIIEDMKEAIKSGDSFKYKNLQHDNFFNFVNTRTKAGVHEVTIEQLELLKDLDKDQFEEYFGVELSEENVSTVDEFVDKLIEEASEINKIVAALDSTYKNPFKWTANPEPGEQAADNTNHLSFESWKKEVAYLNSKQIYLENTKEEAYQNIAKIASALSGEIVADIFNKESVKDISSEYEQEASSLEQTIELTTSARERTKIRKNIKKLRTLGGQASLLGNNMELSDDKRKDYYKALLQFENAGRQLDSETVLNDQDIVALLKEGENINRTNDLKDKLINIINMLTSESGFKKYLETEKDVLAQVIPEEKEQVNYINDKKETVALELNREYVLSDFTALNYKNVGKDRWEVPKPDGTKVYTKTEAQAKVELKDTNDILSAMNSVTVLAILPNGAIKVEDKSGNIYDIDPSRLKGYKKVKSVEEFIDENLEDLEDVEEAGGLGSSSIITIHNKETFGDEGGRRKDEQWLFTSTTSESEDDPDTETSPHVVRSRIFLNNVRFLKNRNDYRTILITGKHAKQLGLEGIVEQSYKGTVPENVYDENQGWMASVFILEKEDESGELKRYFVDENGQTTTELGQSANLDTVIYQTMSTTDLNYKKAGAGKGSPKYRANQKTDAEYKQKQWIAFRKQYFLDENTEPLIFPFRVSRGIPNVISLDARNSVVHLVPESEIAINQTLIQISSSGVFSFQGQNLAVAPGVPIISYGDVAEYLQNRTFNKQEAITLYEVMKVVVTDVNTALKSHKKPSLLGEHWNYVQQVIYTKSKGATVANQIRVNILQRRVQISGVNFSFDTFEENKDRIIAEFEEMYSSVNNKTLVKEFDEPFTEFVLSEKGELKKKEWENYQIYLLSPKDADGTSIRKGGIPLTTNIAMPSDGVPYTHKQKYAILEDIDLPIVERVKPPKTPGIKNKLIKDADANKVYNFNQTEVNTYTFSSGDVSFLGNIKDNAISITILEDEVTLATIETINKIEGGRQAIYDAHEKAFGKQPTVLEKESETNDLILKVQEEIIKYRIATLLGIETVEETIEETIEEGPASYVIDGEIVNNFKLKDGNIITFKASKGVKGKITIEITSSKETVKAIKALEENEIVRNTKDGLVKAGLLVEDSTPQDVALATALMNIEQAVKTSLIPTELGLDFDTSQEKKKTKKKRRGTAQKGKRNLRLKSVNDNSVMTPEDLVIFKKWHAKNLPNIPFETLVNMIVVNPTLLAWGVFEDGIAKFVKGGLRGTEYHEIFEGVWHGMLDNEERTDLINEFRENKGQFTDRVSGKVYMKSDPAISDEMIKERIADDFADWRLKKITPKTFGQKVLDFFNRVLIFFRIIKKNPSLKEDLFEALDSGEFKDKTLHPSVNQLPPQYRAIEGLTELEANDYVEDMIAWATLILFDENNKSTLFEYQTISKDILFKLILEKYYVEDYPDVVWQQLIQRAIEKLRVLNITFDENDLVSINEEGVNNKEYAENPFTVDSKSSSPQALKFLLATLFETKQDKSPNLTFKTTEFVESSIEGYKLLNYSKTFGILIDRLSNTNDINLFMEKLSDLANVDNNFIRLYQRLGGTFIRKNHKNKSFVNWRDFNKYDWRLFIQFYQTFSKQFPEAFVHYNSNGDVYTASINKMSTGRDVRKIWIDNMKLLAQDKESLVFYDKIKRIYKIKPIKATIKKHAKGGWLVTDPQDNKKVFDTEKKAKNYAKQVGISISSDAKSLNFINSIGIEFTEADIKKLDREEKAQFNVAVGTLYKYLGNNNELVTLTGKTLAVNKPFLDLANLYINVNGLSKDSTHFGIDSKRRNNYSLDNAPSILENDFKETNSIDKLKELRPELNDIYSKNSLILTPGTKYSNKNGTWKKRLKVSYIQGSKNISENKAVTTVSLVLSNRHIQEINQNINGNFYIIIPADSSTEWMLNLGNNFSFKEMSKQSKWDKVIPVFVGYLKDEINLALDYKNRSYLKNLKNRGQQLRMFRDILNSGMVGEIEGMIKSGASVAVFDTYIRDNISYIENDIIDMIRGQNNSLKTTLLDNNKIVRTGEDTYSFAELDSNFEINENLDKSQLSEKELNDIFDFLTVNYIVANIEMHKILFGDPYLFATKAGVSEAIKRIKSFLSPAKKMFDFPAYNTFLNDKRNIVGEDIQLTEKDYGYHKYKNHAKTVVLTDLKIAGSLSNTLSNYANTDVTDGFSWIMPGAYREVLDKNGQWGNDAEAFYQYEMAYTRQNIPGYVYTNQKLAVHDKKLLKRGRPEYYLKVLKPIVRGTKHRKQYIDLALDKFAQMAVFYSMVEGTTMEKFYIQMFNEHVDYALVESARKVGIETSHDLYNGDGSFNTDVFNNSTQIPWKYYGIQVETASDGAKYQTRGSQITKMVTINLFANGKPIGATPERQQYIQGLYEDYIDTLDVMHLNAYNSLLSRLGIIDSEDGHFSLENNSSKKISDALVFEMLRRDVSENVKDTIKLDENDQFLIPFEASPSYVQIKDIMYSMINKSLLSPKMSGGSHVQVSSAMFEKATKGASLAMKTDDGWINITKKYYNKLSEIEREKVVLTNDTLKFYEDENGKRYMEIMVPHWFRNQFAGMFESDEALLEHLNSSDELRKALMGIGFRIPTQASSSIEVFKIKGFLPQYMGSTVVVPAEITTKAGSDFDIDKLNMYLKSLYLDEEGKIRYVKVLENEEKTKEYFSNLFDKKLNIDKNNIGKSVKKAREALALEMLDADSKLTGDAETIKNLLGEIYEEADFKNQSLYILFDKLNDDQIQEVLKQRFVENLYKKALENRHYEALEKLITLKENFSSLISPVDDGGYKATAKKIRKLKGIIIPKNTLIDRNYLTKKRNSFALAKKWIGIAATNITGLSNRQKTTVIFDRTRIENLQDYHRKWIGDGTIQLSHNTVEIDGVSYLSLSDITTKEKQSNPFLNFLSNRFSGFATSTVDVANDDYILDVYVSDLLISSAMFIEAMGAGETGRMFLAQPIIQRFVQKLDNADDGRIFNQANIDDVLDEYPVKSTFDPANNIIDMSKLEENISVYAKSKDNTSSKMIEYNEQQAYILAEFLKYTKLGKDMFMLNQATNYDTSKIRNGEEYIRKEIMTQLVEDEGLLTSADDILSSTFIGKQKELMSKAINMLSAVFKLDQPKFKVITNKVLQKYAELSYITNNDFSDIIQNIKVSYLDYLIETNLNLSEEIQSLLLDETNSIALRIKQASLKYKDLSILRDLDIYLSEREGGAQTIKLGINNADAYDDNHYIGLMRELRDFNEETNQLYKDLILISILQGSKRTRLSIKNIIPLEDYAEIVTPIVEQATPNLATDVFAKGMFERNNFTSDTIMPVFYPKFINIPAVGPKQHFTIDKVTKEDVYIYKSVGNKTPIFPTVTILGVNKRDKRLMVVNQRYNFRIIDNEFLKVPRTIQVENEHLEGRREFVDLTTDRAITYSAYREALKKGDTSFYDFFGYQKVKLPDGSNFITTNKHGEILHIYKQIDLLGEGNILTEYYPYFRPSAVDNGTIKVEGGELSDSDIIAYYDSKAPKIAPIKEQYEFLAMKEDNIATIKAGTKSITNRKAFIDNGTYKVKGGSFVSLKLMGQAKVVNVMAGKKVIQFTSGKRMSLDEFAKKEGFKDWTDFSENDKFSSNFINNGQSRYIYDVMPVVLSEEERIAAKEVWKNVKPTPKQTTLFDLDLERPNFDALPSVSSTPTFTYAGVGSRNTPQEVQEEMKKVAEFLATKGYTLRSGNAKGADKAFQSGTTKMEVFDKSEATDITRSIAREIHPNPNALKEGPILDLMARNTNQIFGKNLDVPVDFVLAWTPLTREGKVVSKADDRMYYGKNDPNNTGGTGQAIAMASMKGIPVINMVDPNWRDQLIEVLKKGNKKAKPKIDKKDDFLVAADRIQKELESVPKPEAPEAQQTGPMVFKIDHYILTLNPDGKVFFKNGTEVTDEIIKNKVQIAKEYKQGILRTSNWNNSNYFVLSDDRILGSGKTNYGKESIIDQEIKDKVLDKATLYKKEC